MVLVKAIMETGYTADRMHRRAIVNRRYFRNKNKCRATLGIDTVTTMD